MRRRVSEEEAAAALPSFPASVSVRLFYPQEKVEVVLHSFPVSVNVQLYLKEKEVVAVLRSFPVSADCNFRPFSSRLFRVFSASRLRSIFSALPSVSLPYFSLHLPQSISSTYPSHLSPNCLSFSSIWISRPSAPSRSSSRSPFRAACVSNSSTWLSLLDPHDTSPLDSALSCASCRPFLTIIYIVYCVCIYEIDL